ncbi:MAG: glycosyltransferase family 4 protein [Planctomycetes bacterium]|nr:glycosyltransferase family 4 protein [Planctomycetota bacterium]
MTDQLKILHIYSDWKWTGPSEPVLNLCVGLKKNGHQVTLACLESPERISGRTLAGEAQRRQVPVLVLKDTRKLTGFLSIFRNINKVKTWLNDHPIDIVHTHSPLDNYIGGKAARKSGHDPVLIRTNHHGFPLDGSLRNKMLMEVYTDGYLTLSEKLLESDRLTMGISPEKSWWVNSAVDPERFRPESVTKNLRSSLGIPDGAVVGGIVARMQRHRRFDVLLKAVALAVKQIPDLKIVIIGRGTNREEVAIQPAKKLGLEQNVIFAGYLKDDYINTVGVFDFGLFLVPGSDGSCRAVRELMALGKPMIVAYRGILPEMVEDGRQGIVVKDTPENLAEAIIRMAKDQDLRARYGAAAREKAVRGFSLDQSIKQTEQIYQQVLQKKH